MEGSPYCGVLIGLRIYRRWSWTSFEIRTVALTRLQANSRAEVDAPALEADAVLIALLVGEFTGTWTHARVARAEAFI